MSEYNQVKVPAVSTSGVITPPNRRNRRFRTAFDLKWPERQKQKRIEDSIFLAKDSHRESVMRKQSEAHSRALLRREKATPGSVAPKELKKAEKIVKEQNGRKSKVKFISKRSQKKKKS